MELVDKSSPREVKWGGVAGGWPAAVIGGGNWRLVNQRWSLAVTKGGIRVGQWRSLKVQVEVAQQQSLKVATEVGRQRLPELVSEVGSQTFWIKLKKKEENKKIKINTWVWTMFTYQTHEKRGRKPRLLKSLPQTRVGLRMPNTSKPNPWNKHS